MTDRPNILVIMSDQHNKHVLGCGGDRVVRTPNLDRLAAEGMRFTNAYCASPLCVPSRMSFMTSRRPFRNRVWNNHHVLSSGIPTWAHMLGAAGYETSLIGRMHFVGPDQRHGFENRPIGEFLARPPGAPVPGGPMWTRFPAATAGQSRKSVEIAGRGPTHYQWSDEQVTRAAEQYLRDRGAGRWQRPFAAVIGYLMPHCPFVAPKELFDYYYPRVEIPAIEERQPESIRRFRQRRGILEPPLPAERVRVARAAYFGMIEYMDRLIGRVLDCLEQARLADNTLVIYTTDHGDMAGEHGCWWKSNYYEGSVGVPLIARLPGLVAAGCTCDAVCDLCDLGVTFAEIAQTEFHPPADGRSLWPTLQGRHPSHWRNETFSELVDARDGVAPSRMIRSGPWKLWMMEGDEQIPPALFNLDEDPQELHDLGKDPAFSDVRDRMVRRIRDGWDARAVETEASEADEAYRTLAAWGKAVSAEHPDTLAMPPAEYEADVELL